MKSTGWLLWSYCTSFFGKYSKAAFMTALAIAAVCITASLMVRVSIDDALQFQKDLNDLSEFLHGKPLEPR